VFVESGRSRVVGGVRGRPLKVRGNNIAVVYFLFPPEARLKAEKAVLRAKIEKQSQPRVRKDHSAAVKAFAVKAYERTGDHTAAAEDTEAHFAKRHKKVSLDPASVKRWVTPGLRCVSSDHFSKNARGGAQKRSKSFRLQFALPPPPPLSQRPPTLASHMATEMGLRGFSRVSFVRF